MDRYDISFTLKNEDDMELIDRIREDADYDGPNVMIHTATQGRFYGVEYALASELIVWLAGVHGLEFSEATLEHVCSRALPEDHDCGECDCTPCQEGGLDLLFHYGDEILKERAG